MKIKIVSLFCISAILIASCKKDGMIKTFSPTPYIISFLPGSLPIATPKPIPADNATTIEGAALGRILFYDPILSGNQTQSCASCHKQNLAFTDGLKYPSGIDGSIGTRNAMPLFNLMWNPTFFWDGRDASLEMQALDPIENPIEMKANLNEVIARLNAHPTYPNLFEKAFGNKQITKENLAKAISQFERTLISSDSRYDKIVSNTFDADTFTASELRGKLIFEGNDPKIDGDCTHCHTAGTTFTDYGFKNNGLDAVIVDSGRYLVTKQESDIGKFKTPTLRNVALTAPYMHDGRFKTLDEVIDHYNINFVENEYLDPSMKLQLKARLTKNNKKDLIAFLHTLTDSTFMTNQAFAKPQ
jgi:cytochrome c peroxidase